MPEFMEKQLKSEYPNDPAAPYKVMNAIGAMKGNQETAKGKQMERKHRADMVKKAKKGSRGGKK